MASTETAEMIKAHIVYRENVPVHWNGNKKQSFLNVAYFKGLLGEYVMLLEETWKCIEWTALNIYLNTFQLVIAYVLVKIL